MSQYFDEPPDLDLYPVSHRKIVYVGNLMIPFRTHLASRMAQKFRYEKIKHFLI